MAGDHSLLDPAIVKHGEMMSKRYKYFRFTPYTSWISFVYMVAVPAAVGVLAYKYDGKFEFRGKRRGDPISEY